MMRAVLLLLVVLTIVLAPVGVSASLPKWKQKRVMVYDYSGPEWQVQSAVDYFNEALPKRAPTLIYVRMSGSCVKNPKHITVCNVDPEHMPDPAAAGQSMMSFGGQLTMRSVLILLSTGGIPAGRGLACHELTHAMGVVAHGAWSENRNPTVESCPYDAETMKRIYKKAKKRHR
jgi:hypothetical protein